MFKKTFFYLFFSIFALAGLISGVVGFTLWQGRNQIQKDGEKAIGKVIDLQHSESMTSPIVGFKDQRGRSFVVHSNHFTNVDPYEIGDEVSVYYDPANPDEAILEDENYISLLPFLFLFTHGGVGFGGLIWLERKRRIRKWLLDQGQEVMAIFKSVEEHNNKGWNYTPVFEWNDPLSQITYTYKGDTGSSDPTHYIALGSPVRVLIDPANPKRYLVDQSFMKS